MTIAVTQRQPDADRRNSDKSSDGGALHGGGAKTVTAQVRWYISRTLTVPIRIDGAMQPELTPATITLPRSQTPVEVLLEKQGFRAVRTRLAPVADQSFAQLRRPRWRSGSRSGLGQLPRRGRGRSRPVRGPLDASGGLPGWRQGPKDAALRARRPEEVEARRPKQVLQADA